MNQTNFNFCNVIDIITVGPCIKDGVLDTVCGYWRKQWNLDGPEYLLHFHSDGYITQSGFLINYYAGMSCRYFNNSYVQCLLYN